MGGIVDHLEVMLLGDSIDGLDITRVAVAVHRHDGHGLIRDGLLDLLRIHAASILLNIHEDRLQFIPPDGVTGSHETIRSGDNLPLGDAQRLQGGDQWQCAIGEEGDIVHPQVLRQRLLQLLMIVAVVGNPFTAPDVLEKLIIFCQIRQQRTGNSYDFIVVHILLDALCALNAAKLQKISDICK